MHLTQEQFLRARTIKTELANGARVGRILTIANVTASRRLIMAFFAGKWAWVDTATGVSFTSSELADELAYTGAGYSITV